MIKTALVGEILLDVSIQCRAAIDTALVNEYAERMTKGDKFPPIILFGMKHRSWIGDGWHRVMAAQQIKRRSIEADLRRGGRVEALRYALSSNARHGMRRTNADKRRCVEIALVEFPQLSSRAIAEMCGVDDHLVGSMRPEPTAENPQLKRTGRDGKERPAIGQGKKKSPQQEEPRDEKVETAAEKGPTSEQLPKASWTMDAGFGRIARAIQREVDQCPDDQLGNLAYFIRSMVTQFAGREAARPEPKHTDQA